MGSHRPGFPYFPHFATPYLGEVGERHDVPQMSQPLQPNGIIPAADFPAAAYDSVHSRVHLALPDGDPKRLFVAAWHGVAHRFAGMDRAAARLTASIKATGSAPPPAERSEQEDALFSFFGSAISAFDCCHFAMFAIGAYLNPTAFPLVTERDEAKVNNRVTREAFNKAFPGDALCAALAAFKADATIEALANTRNVLTHRIVGLRHHYMGGAKHGTTDWRGISFDATMLEAPRADAARALLSIVLAADDFAERHL